MSRPGLRQPPPPPPPPLLPRLPLASPTHHILRGPAFAATAAPGDHANLQTASLPSNVSVRFAPAVPAPKITNRRAPGGVCAYSLTSYDITGDEVIEDKGGL